jgi:hypothetical protein
MAVLSITAANVRPLVGAVCRTYTLGGTVDVGDAVYLDSSGNVQRTAAGVAGTAVLLGIVVSIGTEGATSGASGDPASVCIWGPVTGFASVTAGSVPFLSDTAGKLDTAAGTVSVKVGVAESAATVLIRPLN